uniref:Uncharacterized protein n=1 Tax=Rhizophora mucronata TaxID=61149 RepID=A0A2P2LXA1_RHIMU
MVQGHGIHGSFVVDAALKLPMLRRLSLDLCDACEGDFDIPSYSDRCFLSIVKIARCKFQKSSSKTEFLESRRRLVHKGTFVLVWNGKELVRTVVKERL